MNSILSDREQEWLDVVDENDKVIDRKLREEVHAQKLYFRAVCGFIKNSRGQIWIPRRTADKRIFPLGLDMSIAGHVESGESYDFAFARELEEEVNLKYDQINVKKIGFVKATQGYCAFTKIYEISFDQTPKYNPSDFIEYFWLSPQEIVAKIENGEYAKSDLLPLIKKFYL